MTETIAPAKTTEQQQKQHPEVQRPGDKSDFASVHIMVWRYMERLGLKDTPSAAAYFGQTVEEFEKGFDYYNVRAIARESGFDELRADLVNELKMTATEADEFIGYVALSEAAEKEVRFLDDNLIDFPHEAADLETLQELYNRLHSLADYVRVNDGAMRGRARYYFGRCFCKPSVFDKE